MSNIALSAEYLALIDSVIAFVDAPSINTLAFSVSFLKNIATSSSLMLLDSNTKSFSKSISANFSIDVFTFKSFITFSLPNTFFNNNFI